MDSKELFLKTNTKRLFFIAALPGAISMLASALYGLFDGIFVGRILGDTAFAAINLAFPFVIINFALADMIAVGSAVPISINLGKKLVREANNIFTCACILIVSTGALMGIFLYTMSPTMIRMMGAEGEIAELAVQYIKVYAICSPIITMGFATDNYLRISGKIKMSMWINVLMSLSTAVLEFVFLFVLKLDIWGAALATCLCMIGAVLVAFSPFLRGRAVLKLCRPKFSFALVKNIVSCGMPPFLSNIAGRITSISMNVVLLDMGGESAVSVYGILMYVGELVQPIIYGLCDSVSPAIGYNWGAKRYDRVREIVKYCFIASGLVSVFSTVLMLAIPKTLVRLFTENDSPEFMQMSVRALMIYSAAKLLQGICFATQSYMTAVDRPFFATSISVFSAFICPMILIFALYPLGLDGVWLNMPITMALTFIMSMVFLLMFNRQIKKIQKEEKADV